MMRRLSVTLAVVALVAAPAALLGAPAEPPQVGTEIPRVGQRLGPWTVEAGGFWCARISLDCTYALLQSGRRLAVALTHPTRLNARGGVDAEVVVRAFAVDMRPGEELSECGGVGGRPEVLGLLHQGARRARTWSTDGKALQMREMTYTKDPPCDLGED